jgi:hypothetical protein
MTLTILRFFLALLLAAGLRPVRPDTALPVYACPRVDREIVLDGRLSDPLWKTAPAVRLTDTVTGAAAPRPAEVRLLYSATTLYIGFVCRDDYVWGTKTEPDSDIYAEECVEAFLSPSGAFHQYYEIDVSPRNTVFAACILNPRTEAAPALKFRGLKDYHPDGMVTRVSVDGEMDRPGGARSWSVEVAIPFTGLIGAPHDPPRPGDAWRMNLYRIDAPAPGRQEFQAWSPTGRIDFHRPWMFGVLRFL